MNTKDDFAIFIISHGRPNKVVTYKTLLKFKCTKKIYILIDDQDKTREEYIKNFGDKVLIFNKTEIAKITDKGDNFEGLRSTIFPRNAINSIAKNLGIKSFLVLDDDYNNFCSRFDKKLNFNSTAHLNLDKVIDIFLEFLLKNEKLSCLCFSQSGDLIGGKNNQTFNKPIVKRKAMNAFFIKTEDPIYFFGRLNEDVNTYITEGSRGRLFFTTSIFTLNQLPTQSNSGGMTEAYLNFGTYTKSFYSVMYHPSSVKISILNTENARIHHKIKWKNTVPKILSETLKK